MLEETYAVVTEAELLSKISDTENNFIERKTVNDTDGWLKTAVAFANSCPVGQPGILYVGVDDTGKVRKQADNYDFEELQKTISKNIGRSWPPIYFVSHVLKKDGLPFVAAVIFGSPLRPHFSGAAYVRVGPETRNASEEQHDEFVAQRSSKVRALQKLIGQQIYWQAIGLFSGAGPGTISDCNQFFLTVQGGTYKRCFPLDWITISFDPIKDQYFILQVQQ
jgi:hypothetical protein